MIGVPHRPAERDPPPESLPDSETAVHRDYVRKVHQASSGCSVHSHRELMAVYDINSMLAEQVHQPAHAARIDGAFQPIERRHEAGPSKVVTEPAVAVLRTNGKHSVTSATQLLR